MTIKVIKRAGPLWRPYRFPPVSKRRSEPQAAEAGGAAVDPAAVQRAIAEGFQEGVEKGFQEGLAQGQEAGQQEGYRQGFAQGSSKGYEEASASGRQEYAELCALLKRTIDEVELARKGFVAERRQELLELVTKVAKQVIRMELTLHPDQLLVLAQEALAAMPGDAEDVQVLLNPEEYARIKDLAAEWSPGWRLLPDERLALGECRVVTAQAEADVGCQHRLESCMEALSEHMTGEG